MVLVYIRGYDFIEITNKDIQKKEFLSELEIINPEIKNKILSILENDGKIYGLKRNGKLKTAYLFKNITENDEKILVFEESFHTKDVEHKLKACEEAIEIALQDEVNKKRFKKAKWNAREIIFNKTTNWVEELFSLFSYFGITFGLTVGIIYANWRYLVIFLLIDFILILIKETIRILTKANKRKNK